MPARSQAQREYLNAHFGHEWVVEHGFDNEGPLPEHVGDTQNKTRAKRRAKRAHRKAKRARRRPQ